MTVETKIATWKTPLSFREPAGVLLTPQRAALHYALEEERITGVWIEMELEPSIYKHVINTALFHLEEHALGPDADHLSPDNPVNLRLTLVPDLVPELTTEAPTVEQGVEHLKALAQRKPEHPLLSTEAWFALRVTQEQDEETVGYRTLWDYLDVAELVPGDLDGEALLAKALEFLQESLAETGGSGEAPAREELEAAFDVLREVYGAVTGAPGASESPLLEATLTFFQEDQWPVEETETPYVLQTGFEGQNGRWTCFAFVREWDQIFLFYSICPVRIPEHRRQGIAEFITRVNYGLLLGNFELDYNDGEVRFKTSLDVEGDRPSPQLIGQLVYANVLTMDRYLPGLMNVIYGGLSPTTAIARIEGEDFTAHD